MPSSNSMLPTLLPEDKPLPLPAKNLQPNDFLLFKNNNNQLIFHRLIYKHPTQDIFITKGDNNLLPDPPIQKAQILAKVIKVKRKHQILTIANLYQTQSTLYLKHLHTLINQFQHHRLPFILLKGVPLHLYINQQTPQRIFADNDLLIRSKDFSHVHQIFLKLKFKPISPNNHTNQINYLKPTKPFPIIIDFHLKPAISFTKIPQLAQLTPSYQLTSYLFNNTQTFKVKQTNFPILNNEALLIYLLLHLFHHNFKGYHRFQLIADLIKQKSINWTKFQQDVLQLNYQNIVYPGLKLIQHLYLPKLTLPQLNPSPTSRFLSHHFNHQPLTNHFITQTRTQAARQRLLLTLLLAPTPFTKKLTTFLKPSTYISIFRTYLTKPSTSIFSKNSLTSSSA